MILKKISEIMEELKTLVPEKVELIVEQSHAKLPAL
jgi:hypothetical protein